MKKSELKSLLKVIVQEVIAAKKARLVETSGLSGYKKAPDSTEYTEKVADSKDLTGGAPKEKEEGKKLPVVKKPATPQKVGSLKEEILQMIREEIDEMARVKGAVGSKFKVQDPSSPTGWVVKGHKTIPDGTPTEAPKGPYVPKGENPNMGRPKKEPVAATGHSADQATRDAIENILIATPEASNEEILDQLNARVEAEEALNTNPVFVNNTADEIRKERESDMNKEKDVSPEEMGRMEKAAKQKKIANLRAYLMRKKGIKPAE